MLATPTNILRKVADTLDYYLDELEDGKIDARTARQRIMESFANQDLVILHRESDANT